MNIIPEWSDAFKNQVAGRTNVIDLAAHYPYSPVRWRLFVDGSRVYPEYGSVSQYTHNDDSHDLQPAAGETVTFESTERPRYVVQYELAATWAFRVNQALTAGDSIRVGLYDGSDGWYMEQTGSHATDEADFVLERNSSEVYRKEDIDIHLATTTFGRLKIQTGWYDITRQKWERSFPTNGDQQNPLIGKFSADNQRGSRTGNLPLHFSVTADASTSGLVLEAGSAAQVNLGRTTPLTRDKKTFNTASVDSANVWQPVAAYRVDPDRNIVNVQVEDFTLRETSTSADTFVLMNSFAPEHVADGNGDPLSESNFSTPNEHTAQSSVLEVNPNVEQVVDSTGTLQTTMSDPGGYQIEASGLYTGTGQNETAAVGPGALVKRQLSDRDYGVVLVKSSSTGNIGYDIQTEQDW